MLNLCSFYCMHCACQRLDQNCLLQCQFFWNMMMDTLFVEFHIFSKTALCIFLESIDPVSLAHTIISGFTEFAFSTRNHLFRNHTIAFFNTFDILAVFYNSSDKLMSTDNRCFNITVLFRCAPYTYTTMKSLNITCTDSAAFNLY